MILFPRQCINICIRTPSLPRYKSACRDMCDCNKYGSQNIEWSLHLSLKEDMSNAKPWVTLLQRKRHFCMGCLCMLIPKYAVSSRDECVVLAAMTVKESSTQLYWVGVCVHAIMCVAFAARMVLIHISVKILSAVRSRPLTQVSFHVHYFASYFDIVYLEIHHIAWKIARSIVWVKRFDCENCNIKTNVHSH